MHALTTTQGIVALAGVAVGAIALLFALVLAFRMRSLRAGQRAVLGGGGKQDLVIHAERLEHGFMELRDWVEEAMEGLDRRTAGVEGRVDGCIAYRALVRYDAYNELSGQQS